jgi:hypothetical protein
MLDDLRNSATGSSSDPQSPPPFREELPRRRSEPFLGMTAVQRFVLVLVLFLMTCVVGAGALIITGAVYIPF